MAAQEAWQLKRLLLMMRSLDLATDTDTEELADAEAAAEAAAVAELADMATGAAGELHYDGRWSRARGAGTLARIGLQTVQSISSRKMEESSCSRS